MQGMQGMSCSLLEAAHVVPISKPCNDDSICYKQWSAETCFVLLVPTAAAVQRRTALRRVQPGAVPHSPRSYGRLCLLPRPVPKCERGTAELEAKS
jgi:hypothetical protein